MRWLTYPYLGWRGVKKAPCQFSPWNFYKRKNWPENIFDFQFQPFCHTCVNFKVIPSASPNLLNLTNPQKSDFVGIWPFKIEIMITSLKEMLELPDLGHMTTSTS